MKELRLNLTEAEYTYLLAEAERLEMPIKQLIIDRALHIDAKSLRLLYIKHLSLELSEIRKLLNQIIQRETLTKEGLYEEDIIRLEESLASTERIVAKAISELLRRSHGNPEI